MKRRQHLVVRGYHGLPIAIQIANPADPIIKPNPIMPRHPGWQVPESVAEPTELNRSVLNAQGTDGESDSVERPRGDDDGRIGRLRCGDGACVQGHPRLRLQRYGPMRPHDHSRAQICVTFSDSPVTFSMLGIFATT